MSQICFSLFFENNFFHILYPDCSFIYMLNHNFRSNTASTFVIPQITHRTLVSLILQPIHYLKRPYHKYISETTSQVQE